MASMRHSLSTGYLQIATAVGVGRLKRRNHVNVGSGGASQLTTRSVSLGTEALAQAQQLRVSTKPWSTVLTEGVAGFDSCIPTTK
jgi:hypothetical protein